MTTIVYFCRGANEAICIDTQNLNDDQLEEKYGMPVSNKVQLTEVQAEDIVDFWPTDRLLK